MSRDAVSRDALNNGVVRVITHARQNFPSTVGYHVIEPLLEAQKGICLFEGGGWKKR